MLPVPPGRGHGQGPPLPQHNPVVFLFCLEKYVLLDAAVSSLVCWRWVSGAGQICPEPELMSEQRIFIYICLLELELLNLGYILLLSGVLLGAASAKLSAGPRAGWVAARGQAVRGKGLSRGSGMGCPPPFAQYQCRNAVVSESLSGSNPDLDGCLLRMPTW